MTITNNSLIKIPTPQEARAILWRRGDISSFLLDSNQKYVKDFCKDNKGKTIVVVQSRQVGKSYGYVTMAVEECINNKDFIVCYFGPRLKQTKRIVRDVMTEILNSCPKDLRPRFDRELSAWIFPNGSRMELYGVNSEEVESARGGKAHLVILDECGFMNDLKYALRSVIRPKLNTTKGTALLCSTLPKSQGHEFYDLMKQAQYRDLYVTRDVYQCPRFTKEDIDLFAEEVGGYDSVDFKREYCLDENVLIKTKDGFKKIKDIEIGDYVWTHIGRYKKVVNKFKNEVKNKEVYEILSSGGQKEIVTEGHKLRVSTTNYTSRIESLKDGWVSVENVIPKEKRAKVFFKYPIDELDGSNFDDEELAYLSGWYTAEGHCQKTIQHVNFALNIEKDDIDTIKKIVKTKFNKTMTQYESKSSDICKPFGINSKQAKDYFLQFGRTSLEKRIPFFIKNASTSVKIAFLKGLFLGDGSISYERKSVRLGVISQTLIQDVYEMLLSLGINCSHNIHEKPKTQIILGLKCNIHDLYYLDILSSDFSKFIKILKNQSIDYVPRYSRSFIKNGFYYNRILSIKKIEYTKKYVYDLTVEDDHSYCGLGTVFHNCNIMITDEDHAVLPEANDELLSRIVKEYKRPPYYDPYISMDIGAKDLTFIVFAYYDFATGKIIIEDEAVFKGKMFTTYNIALTVEEYEKRLWGLKKPFLRVADNNNLIMLNDLRIDYNMPFIATAKDNKHAWVNQLRIMLADERIIINPRCKQLQFHLKNATWNKNKTDYERSVDGGHYDAVDACAYLIRNIAYGKNPYPKGYGNPYGDSYIEVKGKVVDNFEKSILDMFSVKKKSV